MLSKRLFALFVAAVFSVQAQAQWTGSGTATVIIPTDITTTPALMAEAVSSFPACGMWHSSGLCFFLVCGWGCHIVTKPRFSHMRPDLVVSTYHDLDNHPWPGIGLPLGQIALQGPSKDAIRAVIHGRTAHAGLYPERGVSAIQVAARAIERMQLLRPRTTVGGTIGRSTAVKGPSSTRTASRQISPVEKSSSASV